MATDQPGAFNVSENRPADTTATWLFHLLSLYHGHEYAHGATHG